MFKWSKMPTVGVDLHSCSCGNLWQLGKGGPSNVFEVVIPPGHQHVLPQAYSFGRHLWQAKHYFTPRWARQQKSAITSLKRLCRVTTSPCQQVTAWWPRESSAISTRRSFDEEVKQCFAMYSAINVTNDSWSQAQFGPKFGGLGLRSLSIRALAVLITSTYSRQLQCSTPRFPSPMPSRLVLLWTVPFPRRSCQE